MFFPASTNGNGQSMAMPDVCMTPAAPSPIPVPYPNIAMMTQASGSSKVKICGSQSLRKGDAVSMTSGDEAGNAPGGQMSGGFKGKATFKMGFSKVKVQGKAITRLGATLGQNGNNANAPMGTQMVPSQMKVKVGG